MFITGKGEQATLLYFPSYCTQNGIMKMKTALITMVLTLVLCSAFGQTESLKFGGGHYLNSSHVKHTITANDTSLNRRRDAFESNEKPIINFAATVLLAKVVRAIAN